MVFNLSFFISVIVLYLVKNKIGSTHPLTFSTYTYRVCQIFVHSSSSSSTVFSSSFISIGALVFSTAASSFGLTLAFSRVLSNKMLLVFAIVNYATCALVQTYSPCHIKSVASSSSASSLTISTYSPFCWFPFLK